MNLPPSSSSTWLEDFTVANIIIMGICTFESCLILALSAPKEGEQTYKWLITAFLINRTGGSNNKVKENKDTNNGTSLQNEPNKDMFGNFSNEEAQFLKSSDIKPASIGPNYPVVIVNAMTQVSIPISFITLRFDTIFV